MTSPPSLNNLWQDLALDVVAENPRPLRALQARARRRKITWLACCASVVLLAGTWGGWVLLHPRDQGFTDNSPKQKEPVQGEPGPGEIVPVPGSLASGNKVEFGVLSDQELEEKLGLLNMAVVGTGDDQRVIFLGKPVGH